MLQGEHSAILSTFIKLPFVIIIFVLSIFEWPLKTGFTVHVYMAAQWLSGRVLDWMETEGPRVQVSPVSLHCVLDKDTLILA